MPFDGSFHSYERICQLIDTNFKDYMDNVTYENNMFVDNSNGSFWNHEQTNDRNNFQIQIWKRVKQFEEILQTNERIMFLIHYKKYNTEFDFDILNNVLKRKYPNLRYSVFVFNNYCSNYYKVISDNTTYLNIFWDSPDKPYSEINDNFTAQMYKTPYGIEFSRRVLIELCEALGEYPHQYIMNTNYNFDKELL